ncbi:hypothetical protein [Planctomycetes bacterium TBK1r]|uniref:Bacterial extracellular solute-binding protein n=1 Tax=Stieleria magnilauensis TaxID=2527963 RepID=A0ABX5XUF7_9BACT|nr:hypothetical protein TBK1r_32310 [Planctomycetes bacterium TBK1r]
MSRDFRSRPIDRRTAVSILAASVVAGCGDSGIKSTGTGADSATSSAQQARSEVPLRILIAGSLLSDGQSVAESIRVAWSMTQDQPLNIEVFDGSVSAGPVSDESAESSSSDDAVGKSRATDFAAQMLLADVAIAPQSYLGEIRAQDAAVRFSDELLKEYQTQYGKPFPAVINGLGDYGGNTWGIAVGAKVLALLALESEVQCDSWAAYHDWVEQLYGKAAEPLAPGWAGSSFLNRCASTFTRRWLFNRATMKPEIDSEDYVAALEQLAATAKRYPDSAMTPGQIWHAIRRGELAGGIGYEVPDAVNDAESDQRAADGREEFEVSVFDCPRETETDQLWLGPQTPLACLSSGCRQTSASKQFIGWLSGGERISTVRQQIGLFSQTRTTPGNESSPSGSPYARWLAERLQTLQVTRGLILPGADRYYAVLDRQVRRCLAGEQSAAEALADAATQWDAITDELGREQQSVAWKRTLGFGG